MQIIDKLKDYFFISDDSYEKISDSMLSLNHRTVKVFSGISMFAYALMIAVSCVFRSINRNIGLYIALFLCSLICFLLAVLPYRNHRRRVTTCMYLFISTLLAYGIILGTFIDPEEITVSYIVMLFAIPLVFTDKPLRINLVLIASMLVYAAIAKETQSPLIFEYNMLDVIPYGILSMLLNVIMTKIKVERLLFEQENKYLVHFDQLTGLLNRRSFDEFIQEALEGQYSLPLLVCMFDCNNLKSVNDTFGHQAGDFYLSAAADCISKVFGEFGKCYRTGGDEFCAVLSGDYPPEEKLRCRLDDLTSYVYNEFDFEISLAMGCAVIESPEKTNYAVSLADRNMYKFKNEYHAALLR